MNNFRDKLLQHESAERYTGNGAKVSKLTTIKKAATDIFINLHAHFSLVMISKAPGGGTLETTSHYNFLGDKFFGTATKMVGLSVFGTRAYPMIFPKDDIFMATANRKLPSFAQMLEISSKEDVKNMEVKGKSRKVYSAVMITPKILKMLEKFKVLAPANILGSLVTHICTEMKASIVKAMM